MIYPFSNSNKYNNIDPSEDLFYPFTLTLRFSVGYVDGIFQMFTFPSDELM